MPGVLMTTPSTLCRCDPSVYTIGREKGTPDFVKHFVTIFTRVNVLLHPNPVQLPVHASPDICSINTPQPRELKPSSQEPITPLISARSAREAGTGRAND